MGDVSTSETYATNVYTKIKGTEDHTIIQEDLKRTCNTCLLLIGSIYKILFHLIYVSMKKGIY
jgi:hypothetical protein